MNDDEEFAETELGAPTFDLGSMGSSSMPAQAPPRDAPSVPLDEPEALTMLDGFSRGPEPPAERSAPREAAAARAQRPRVPSPTARQPLPAASDVPLYVALGVIVVLLVGLIAAAVVAVVLEVSG